MTNSVREILSFGQALGFRLRYSVYLTSLAICSSLFEMFGVTIFLPIFQFIRFDSDIGKLVNESKVWAYFVSLANHLNIEITIGFLLTVALFFFLLRQLFMFLRAVYQTIVRTRQILNIRAAFFHSYLCAKVSFFDRTPAGDVLGAMTTEVPAASAGLLTPSELGFHIFGIAIYLSVLAALSWEMTTAGVLVIAVASRLPSHWARRSKSIAKEVSKVNVLTSRFLLGRLKSPRLIRLARTESIEERNFRKILEDQKNREFRISILKAKTDIAIEPIVVALSLVFIYFSVEVLKLSLESLGLYLLVSLRLMPLLKGATQSWFEVQKAYGAIELVINRKKEIDSARERCTGQLPVPSGEIGYRLQNVSYSYTGTSELALDDVNLEIPAGKITVLVGPSGGGKSTILDLISGLRPPSSGEVLLARKRIELFDPVSVRTAMSFLPQQHQLFLGTIEDHIRYGNPDASAEDIRKGARQAGAHGFIERLPDGYNTALGEDGTGLSGGQKQRLDLARVLTGFSSIAILDEPTSSVDKETEREIFDSLKLYSEKTHATIIIVTHRIEYTAYADHVICLVKGRVESQGAPHSLTAPSTGWLAEMRSAQIVSPT